MAEFIKFISLTAGTRDNQRNSNFISTKYTFQEKILKLTILIFVNCFKKLFAPLLKIRRFNLSKMTDLDISFHIQRHKSSGSEQRSKTIIIKEPLCEFCSKFVNLLLAYGHRFLCNLLSEVCAYLLTHAHTNRIPQSWLQIIP